MKPFFSVIIPLYNKEREIENTLNSVFQQTFTDYEILVINDGSTDNSEEKIHLFSDKRLRLITTKNRGVSQARNLGIQESKGSIIAFIDGDDYWFPTHLESLFDLHQHFPEAGLLATNYEFYFGENNIIYPSFELIPKGNWKGIVSDFFQSSLTYRIAWTSAVGVPSFVFDSIGNFDENITLGAGEDTDMWIRIALSYPVAFSNEISARYNMTAENKISFSDTTKRNFARLDKFYQQEKVNPSLKKFLDLYRVVYALKHKLAGDDKQFNYYYQSISKENCSLKSKILLKLPTFILKRLFVFGRLMNSNKMYFHFYTRLFKS
jgi:glycosyltransferase involved in cell wall biosynthesis